MTEMTIFSYGELDTETRVMVQQKTTEIRDRVRRSAQDIVEIGERLLDVKGRLGHGQFGAWLNAEFAWSEAAATRYMQVARAFAGQNRQIDEFAPSALYTLAAPATPAEARSEALQLAASGERVTNQKAQEIVQKHKPAPPAKPTPTPPSAPATPAPRPQPAPVALTPLPAPAQATAVPPPLFAPLPTPAPALPAVADEEIAAAPAGPAPDAAGLLNAEARIRLLQIELRAAQADAERARQTYADQGLWPAAMFPASVIEMTASNFFGGAAWRAQVAMLAMSGRVETEAAIEEEMPEGA